jgi:hypothetical protein
MSGNIRWWPKLVIKPTISFTWLMSSHILTVFLLVFLMAGCTAKTTITQPDGQTYEVVSQKDAVVHAKLGNAVSLTVDNRGEGGIMSDIIKMWSLKFITESEVEK